MPLWTRLGILHHENGDVISLIPDNEVIHIHSELKQVVIRANFFHESIDFCRLLITYANSLDPEKNLQN